MSKVWHHVDAAADKEADMVAIERGLGPLSARASQIKISLRADNKVCMVATCMGRPDAAYASFAEDRLPVEIAKLLAELRERESELTK